MSQADALDYAAPDPLPPAPPKGAMLTLFFIVLMGLFGFGVIIPLLPFYAVKYEASSFEVGVVFALYSLCQLISAPLLGMMSDRYGRRGVLIFSQLGAAAGYILLGVVTALEWANPAIALWLIYLSRAIEGISAGNISTAQAYVSDITTEENRSKGMGLLGAAFGIGFAAGPAAGGLLGDMHVSLPAFVAAAFSLVAVALTWWLLPETRVHKASADAVLLHPARLKFIVQRPALLQLLGIWVLSMGAYVVIEGMLALFLSRPDTYNYGPKQVGLVFTLFGVTIVIVQGGLIGRLVKLFGDWWLAIVGPLVVAAAMIGFVQTAYTPLLSLLLVTAVCNSGGRSLQGPALAALVSRNAGRDEQGATFGAYHALGSLARVIGPLVGNALYARHMVGPFVLSAVLLVVASGWTLLVYRSSILGSAVEPVPTAEEA